MRGLILVATLLGFISVSLATDGETSLLIKRLLAAFDEINQEEQALEKRAGIYLAQWSPAERTITVHLSTTTDCKGYCTYAVRFTGPGDKPLSQNISLVWGTNGIHKFVLNKNGKFVIKNGAYTGKAKGDDIPSFVKVTACKRVGESGEKECNTVTLNTGKVNANALG